MVTRQQRRWWLILGALAYISVFVYSVVASLPFPSAYSTLVDTVDWLAASVTYFFLGALVGFGVDRFLARKQKTRGPTPDFVWWTLVLWLVGAVVANIVAPEPTIGYRVLYLFFPIIYGVFFTSFAWTSLAPSIVATLYGKMLLNLGFLFAAGGWLWLEVAQSKRLQLKRALLLLVFLVLIFGTVSCARQLG